VTRRAASSSPVRTLCIVLGDQLDADAPAIAQLDPKRDAVLMMEVSGESRHVPSHKQRTVLFLSAMRHFAADLESRGLRVRYVKLDDPANTQALETEIARAARDLSPARLVMTQPGEQRLRRSIADVADELGLPLDVLPDEHFLTTPGQFATWAAARKELVMEFFYRKQRERLNVLLTHDGKPVSGQWNLDADNRRAFPKSGPSPRPPAPIRFEPDDITREVIAAVSRTLPDLPGRIDSFGWPVTREQSLEALQDFVDHRLADFGPFEDAMWTTEPFVYHSLLSAPLNLKLLRPRECVDAALKAFEKERAPLQSVEGFIRQIIGWREFIRGVYDFEGPAYRERNSLGQTGALPWFYWSGDTDMNCMKHAIGQVLDHAYGHHIQRLMVTGNFALIAGVDARRVNDWYLGMYVDAVDWATTPNTLGMSQHADARPGSTSGVVGTKPYVASGNYIDKMSNYCRGCAYNVKLRTGERACPFNTFYWDFLIRHQGTFKRNLRMTMMLKHVEKMTDAEREQISADAARLRARFGIEGGAAPPHDGDSPPRDPSLFGEPSSPTRKPRTARKPRS
jgi:deoxyribodipyrimidine photolyase-related protein